MFHARLPLFLTKLSSHHIPLNLPVIGPTVVQVFDGNLDASFETTNKDYMAKAHADIIDNQPIMSLTRIKIEDDQSKADPLASSIAGNFEN